MSSVSIIVPFFNEAQTLPLCLSSLRQQTMQDIEVILIDDGSTDTGREIAERYVTKTAHVLVQTPNKGQGYARNEGLQYVTSPFLTFVDADDILLPRACELLMDVSSRYNADIVYGGHGEFNNFNELFPVRYLDWFLRTDEHLNLRHDERSAVGSPVVTGKLFRTQLIRDNGIKFPVNCYVEDTVFAVKAWAAAREIRATKEIIYARNPVQMKRKPGTLKKVRDRFKVIKMIDKLCDSHDLPLVKYDSRVTIFRSAFRYLTQILPDEEKREAFDCLMDFLKKNEDMKYHLTASIGLTFQELSDCDPADLTETNYLYWKTKRRLLDQLDSLSL